MSAVEKRNIPETLGIIAGNGRYPFLLAESARQQGVNRLVVAAFQDETDPLLEEKVDVMRWLRVGQLGKLCQFFQREGVQKAMMVGQIAPKNLFQLRPDWKALWVLARLKERNAETLFGAVADELASVGTQLLPATCFLENFLAPEGCFAGPKLSSRQQEDVHFGFSIAKEVSRLDIGQSVVVKEGTVLAVEAFEGTDAALSRGGSLGKGGAVLVKVSKPNQDFRFDVPVIGLRTLATAQQSGIAVIACEARKTLLLEIDQVKQEAEKRKISLVGVKTLLDEKR